MFEALRVPTHPRSEYNKPSLHNYCLICHDQQKQKRKEWKQAQKQIPGRQWEKKDEKSSLIGMKRKQID